jgi:hypothetical protein
MQAITSCSGGTTTAAHDDDAAVGVAHASGAVSNAQKDAIEPGAASGGASGEFSCG